MALGRQKLIKEILGHLRSQHRGSPFIRREDLLGMLAGKAPPPRLQQPRPAGLYSPSLLTLDQLRLQSSPTQPNLDSKDGCTPALYMFHEALDPSQDVTPASSEGSPGSGRGARGSPSRRTHPLHRQELSSFLLDEVRRHRKRRNDSGATGNSFSQGSSRSPGSGCGGKRRRL